MEHCLISVYSCVSIHTPTQGVTSDYEDKIMEAGRFNPHTHAGCDLLTGEFVYGRYGFNPHTHAGCDVRRITSKLRDEVSIHTPTQGVTINDFDNWPYVIVSIHTPTQGVTSSNAPSPSIVMFQSTHPRRV